MRNTVERKGRGSTLGNSKKESSTLFKTLWWGDEQRERGVKRLAGWLFTQRARKFIKTIKLTFAPRQERPPVFTLPLGSDDKEGGGWGEISRIAEIPQLF